MNIQEARRAAFEKWWNVHYGATESWIASSRTDSGYSGPATQEAWEAWNAALDSVVVELPSASKAHNNEVIKAVGRYIWAQGIRVEVKS